MSWHTLFSVVHMVHRSALHIYHSLLVTLQNFLFTCRDSRSQGVHGWVLVHSRGFPLSQSRCSSTYRGIWHMSLPPIRNLWREINLFRIWAIHRCTAFVLSIARTRSIGAHQITWPNKPTLWSIHTRGFIKASRTSITKTRIFIILFVWIKPSLAP